MKAFPATSGRHCRGRASKALRISRPPLNSQSAYGFCSEPKLGIPSHYPHCRKTCSVPKTWNQRLPTPSLWRMSSSERIGIASGASESDERTPLLHQPEDDGSSGISEESSISETYTPLPKLQLGVCLLIQFAEPITALCIFPFINQLISELDITHGDKKTVGYYVGIIVCICVRQFLQY